MRKMLELRGEIEEEEGEEEDAQRRAVREAGNGRAPADEGGSLDEQQQERKAVGLLDVGIGLGF